ncbi:MAG: DUF4062 domain-containing protein [Chloroflexi bacterium]|nr:DUF4062 domain-containing protein [Chloroflexota bacterium]
MAKIYVSSTYLDLQEFREKILFHLHRLQQAVGAMEYYLADDRLPAAKCVADVKACDIYVGVYAWRYGTIPDAENLDRLSITEMEYRAAREEGIPCLIFLHDGKSPWSPDLVDDDKTRIKTFRKKVESEQSAQWFKTADELASLVGASLYDKLNALGYGAQATSVTTFDLEKYFAALRKRYGVLALEGLTPPQKEEYLQIQLRQVFVEQNVRENPPPVELPKEVWEKLSRDKEIHPDDLPSGITLDDVRRAREAYYEKPSRPVLDVLTDSRYPHAIILGDPGSGKSTLARFVMLSLIDPATADDVLQKAFAGCLPLLIELRSYAGLCADDKCNSFLEFLEYLGKTEGWALTQSALQNHLKNDGRAVVIFDGLDEIFDPEQRERITRQIVGFCGDYPKARVIVTSRVIGYRRKILTDAGFTHFTLQDLDEKQVETFVNRWYDLAMSDRPDEAKERRERILKSFKESASIRQLAGNPMLLTIMAIIGKHQELPRERWKLYDHAASVLIQHWDVNKHLKDARIDADFIGEDDKKELLRRLAFRMQGGDGGLAGNYIHREQLQAEFEGYLRERYAQTPDRAKAIAEAMIQQFRERNFILSLYGANLYGFVHRAFLEFFCASAFVWKFEKTKELTIEQLKTDVYGKHWEDQSWHEVLRLICWMLNIERAGQIVDYVLGLVPDLKRADFGSSPPLNIELSLTCFDEVDFSSGLIAPFENLISVISELCLQNEHWEIGQEHSKKKISMQEKQRLIQSAFSRDHFFDDLAIPLRKIIRGWPSSGVAPLLQKWAVKSESYELRSALVSTLAEHCHDQVETLPFLLECSVKDTDWNVRYSAIASLANFYPGETRTRTVFYDRAINDVNYYVRYVAMTALVKFFAHRQDTQMLVRDRAINDASPQNRETREFSVRSSALDLMAERWPANPDTMKILQERAAKDPVLTVRKNARRLIKLLRSKKE